MLLHGKMRYLIKVHQSHIIKNHKIVYLTCIQDGTNKNSLLLLLKKKVKLLKFELRGTRSENTPSSKTEALTKSMNVYIWTIDTLKQLFIRGSSAQIKLLKQ